MPRTDLDFLIIAICFFGCVVLFKIIRSARDGITWWLSALTLALVGSFAGLIVATSARFNSDQQAICALLGASIAVATKRRRSRHIRASTRRRVIARDLKGEKFDPRKHHIDHVWPYSKGGSHTADNLRVIDKKENLKKGAKRPSLWDLFG